MLVSRRFRKSYRFADDDRILITKPETMSEISAIRALRTGISPLTETSSSGDDRLENLSQHGSQNRQYRLDLALMMQQGWERSTQEINDFKAELQHKNEDAVRKILRDI